MKINSSKFFEEATHKICSTLYLPVGMLNLLPYLQNIMHIKYILVACMFPQSTCIKVSNTGVTVFQIPEMSEKGKKRVKDLHLDNPEYYSGGILIDSIDHPLYQLDINKDDNIPISLPWFLIRLSDGGNYLGGCCFCGEPEHPFTLEEQKLLRSLESVLCMAFSNYMKYEIIVQAKDNAQAENKLLRHATIGDNLNLFIGESNNAKKLMEKVSMVAPSHLPILIEGETGTGKEVAARAIHTQSKRKGAFVAINCGALPSSLIDSELFGHVKGAFTGATDYHKGRFERANKGTLFLDEIGEMSLEAQIRLLRVIQEKEIEPVGATKTIPIDVRIIAATNKDLRILIKQGLFREDLFFRLRVVNIYVPPLRDRIEDIPLLTKYFFQKFSLEAEDNIPELAIGEMERMMTYSWPGNIRELQNVLLEAMVSSPTKKALHIKLYDESPEQLFSHEESTQKQHEPSDFSKIHINSASTSGMNTVFFPLSPLSSPLTVYHLLNSKHVLSPTQNNPIAENNISLAENSIQTLSEKLAQSVTANLLHLSKNTSQSDSISELEQASHSSELISLLLKAEEQKEAQRLLQALTTCHGRIKGPQGAAELLGMAPSTLRRRLEKLNIPFGHHKK